MHSTNPAFTADNIIAILDAAPAGGTIEDVIERSKAPVSTASVTKWLKDGKRDLQQDRRTAYALFTEQWDTVYPGAPPRNEAARMKEMQKVLERLGIKQDDIPPAQQAASRSRKPANKCECGNEKGRGDPSCSTCASIDGSRPSITIPQPAGCAA